MLFSFYTIPMHCTNNIRVHNAHSLGSASAIELWPCFTHLATPAASGACIENASGPYLPGEERALDMIAAFTAVIHLDSILHAAHRHHLRRGGWH